MTKLVFRVLIVSLFTSIIVTSNLAQTEKSKEERRVRYISTAPKANNPRKPRIKFVKKKLSTKTVKKLKPTNYKLEKKTFKLINQKRKEKGLPKLKWDSKLADLARDHSEKMAKHNFFSHVGLNGRMVDQRADDFGMKDWKAIGENIAFNKGIKNSAEFAVERWMLSTSHRKNLLDSKWTHSGIGVGITQGGKYFFTQIFYMK